MSANISGEAQSHGGYRGTLLMGRRVCWRGTAVVKLEMRGASKSTTESAGGDGDKRGMIIWKNWTRSRCSITLGNVPAAWAAAEWPGLMRVCVNTQRR